jgi:linoleoyl-CoA desaturase
MQPLKNITFSSANRDFAVTLNKRVNEYFRSNNISRHANAEMIIKTVCMFGAYFIPYFLILTGVISGPLSLITMAVVMGLGLAGVGLSVMHDANHGAYSKKNWVNTVIGYSLNLIGANAFNWKIQHNVLHHTFTNVHEEDEDIRPRGALRLTPHARWNKFHRYQFIYAWFLYGLMTLTWMFATDFSRLIRYQKNGLARKHKAIIAKEWMILIATKLFYVTYIFILPLVFTSLPWWQILTGLVIMHYLAGFILAIIFQPAHVIEGTEFPLPNEDHAIEHNWTVHQLLTTTNFGNGSRWFSWYVGGLNFQIEHHLFPNVCHVHYREIASIVKQTTAEFGLPYKSSRTFVGALAGHARLLRELGKRPALVVS